MLIRLFQQTTSEKARVEALTPAYSGLLKQADKQESSSSELR
jgi:hypothetical protein